ncbi:hypothetical protein SCALM49S_06834 [Streptomyces californicus]
METAAALSASRAKPGTAAAARCTNSSTALDRATVCGSVSSGSASGGTGCTTSPGMSRAS